MKFEDFRLELIKEIGSIDASTIEKILVKVLQDKLEKKATQLLEQEDAKSVMSIISEFRVFVQDAVEKQSFEKLKEKFKPIEVVAEAK